MSDKFRELQRLKELSIQKNWESTKEELLKQQENPREKQRLARQQKKLERALEKQDAKDTGRDLHRENSMLYSIEETEKWAQKQEEKEARKDTGFTDYHQLAYRKYQRMVNDLKPNMEAYHQDKLEKYAARISNAPSSPLDFLSHKPSKQQVGKLLENLAEQQEKRKNFSKKRKSDLDHDSKNITFINARNERFNKKIGRAFDEYTKEYREALERGSAL